MKVLVQWATNPPGGWQEVDSRDWPNLAKKSLPPLSRSPIFDSDDPQTRRVIGFTGKTLVIDSLPGWVEKFCIQGMGFSGDNLAVVQHEGFVEAIVWNDDPGDWDPGMFVAYVWRFHPAKETKTHQELVVYAGKKHPVNSSGLMTGGRKVVILNFQYFTPPAEKYIRHGIWMLEDLANAHRATMAPSWRIWIGDPA